MACECPPPATHPRRWQTQRPPLFHKCITVSLGGRDGTGVNGAAGAAGATGLNRQECDPHWGGQKVTGCPRHKRHETRDPVTITPHLRRAPTPKQLALSVNAAKRAPLLAARLFYVGRRRDCGAGGGAEGGGCRITADKICSDKTGISFTGKTRRSSQILAAKKGGAN